MHLRPLTRGKQLNGIVLNETVYSGSLHTPVHHTKSSIRKSVWGGGHSWLVRSEVSKSSMGSSNPGEGILDLK